MDALWILVDALSVAAVLIVGLLVFLLLFEPGLYYRLAAPVHDLEDDDKLHLLTGLVGGAVRQAEEVLVFSRGEDFYAAQLAAIVAARHTVHLEAYIFQPGQVANRFIDALCERAGSGVRVRVVVDALGSRGLSGRTLRHLRGAGVEIHKYHALRWYNLRRLNNRTHRNLLILDGALAFIGGAGIGDYWCRERPPPWRDTVLQLSGELVCGLQTVFAENWLECTGELLASEDNFPQHMTERVQALPVSPTSPGIRSVRGLTVGSTPTSGRSNHARVLIQYLLAGARADIQICSPYFIPDRGIRRELIAARKRGVTIEVITGGPYIDHHLARRAGRKRYGELLLEGVAVHEYARGMLHAKVILVDGYWAVIGSTNFDHRSFGINDEVNAVLLNRDLVRALAEDFAADRAASSPFTYEDWRARTWHERMLAWFGTLVERHQ
jgi:cardiolipin synthase A/B